MRLELVSIPTPTLALDGLYATPEHGPARGCVIFFHGNCMNFYTGPSRFLMEPLVEAGLAVLTFNRRGHDVLYTHGRHASGGAYQKAAEMVEDNALAAAWLAERSHTHPIVMGYSNGGMLAVPHVAARPETPAMILLSAHLGGKQIVPLMSGNGLFARDRLEELTQVAHLMVSEGRGEELMLLPGWWHVTTAETFLDYSNNVPDLIKNAPHVTCPTLAIRGDKERADIYPIEAFASHSGGPTDTQVIADCDHFYGGQEKAITERVLSWLAKQHLIELPRAILS